jgi:hypothetical protein
MFFKCGNSSFPIDEESEEEAELSGENKTVCKIGFGGAPKNSTKAVVLLALGKWSENSLGPEFGKYFKISDWAGRIAGETHHSIQSPFLGIE